MYCPACGEEIDEAARYCRYCGDDIPDLDEPEPAFQRVDGGQAPTSASRNPSDRVSSAPLSVYIEATHRYYWLGLLAAAGYLASVLLYVFLYGVTFATSWLHAASWASYLAMVAAIYLDTRVLRRASAWTPSYGVLIGLAIPYLNIILGFYYLYRRHRETVTISEDDARLSYSGWLVGGVAAAAVSIAVLPVVFGPIAIYAGYRIRSTWDRRQGTVLLFTGVISAGVGWIIGFLLMV